MNAIKLKPGQTVFDVVIEQFGGMDGLSFLVADNEYDGHLIFGDIDLTNETVNIRENSTVDQAVIDYHFNNVLVSY